jgi:hypothetical protein
MFGELLMVRGNVYPAVGERDLSVLRKVRVGQIAAKAHDIVKFSVLAKSP